MSIHHNIIYGIHDDTKNRIFVSDSRPCDKDKIKCEVCSNVLVAKKGNIKIHHYAHKYSDIINCDDWAPKFKSDSDHHWHLQWQYFFKNNDFGNIECVIKKEIDNKIICHRADIITKTNYIIEIQHSNISDKDVVKREDFYGDNLLWIINGRQDMFVFLFYTENDYYIGQYHKEFIYSFKRNIIIDTDYGLFELIKLCNDRYCIVKRVNSRLKTICKKLTKCFDKNIYDMKDINDKLKEHMKNNNLEYNDCEMIKKIDNIHYCKEYDNLKDIFKFNNNFTSPIFEKCDYKRFDNIAYDISREDLLLNFDEQPIELIKYAIRNNINNYKFIKNKSYELDKMLLYIDGRILQFIDLQSDELCEIACKYNIDSYKYIKNKTYELDKILLNINGLILQFIDNQNDELCEIACKNNINAYQYIKNKSYELDKKLLNINGLILQFIDNQTDELCEIACINNIDAYQYIKNKSYDLDKKLLNSDNIYKIFIKNILKSDGLLLQFINNQTDEMCIIACKNNINSYQYIKNKSYNLDKILLNNDGRILQFMNNQTDELCEIAIKNNIYAYQYIKNKTIDLDNKLLKIDLKILQVIDDKIFESYMNFIKCKDIIQHKDFINKYYELDKKILDIDGLLINYIDTLTDELCEIAIKNNINAYKYIKNKTYELNRKLLNINGLLLQFIYSQDDKLCIIALKQNILSYQYVKNKNTRIKLLYEKLVEQQADPLEYGIIEINYAI